jgi:hypothetical protein
MNAKFRLAVSILVAALATAGCGGSGGNNDQGIVFRAVGIYRGLESIELGRITCTEPTVQNAIVDTSFTLDIGTAVDFPNRTDPFGDPCGGYIALENNLDFESMNVQEIVIRYEIPGAGVQLPDHSVSFGQRILPASSETEVTSGQPNLIFAELVGQILPRTHIVFLNQNVNLLPSTPYLLNAFLDAKGQSDTGENYTTNEIGYTFTIVF